MKRRKAGAMISDESSTWNVFKTKSSSIKVTGSAVSSRREKCHSFVLISGLTQCH